MDADRSEQGRDALLVHVLESAAHLQQAVPDAVLVGGGAAAWYAGHRLSFDHDRVLTDLRDRFDAVLEAAEATDGGVTDRVTPHKIILGRLGDVEAGVRQLRRRRPLDVTALAERAGTEEAARVLLTIDEYYEDQRSAAGERGGVGDQLVRQLSDPRPADTTVIAELPRYEGLAARWHDRDEVRARCAALAAAVLGAP